MDTAPFIPPPGPSGESASAVATALAALMTLIGRAPPIFPAPPASMTRAQEAQMTREYAWEFFRSDPRFAADLCAAADHHERGGNA